MKRVRVELVESPDTPGYEGRVTGPRDAAEALAFLTRRDREHFATLLLATTGDPIGVDIVSKGTLNKSLIHPREVYKSAILANADTIIAAHNHPSGDPTPSQSDIDTFHTLKDAGNLLNIPLNDFLITTPNNHYSFKQHNHL